MHQSLRVVVGQFPDAEAQTVALFERDDVFRDLCEEYEACTEAIARLKSADDFPPGIGNEYSALSLRLERELLCYLEQHGNG